MAMIFKKQAAPHLPTAAYVAMLQDYTDEEKTITKGTRKGQSIPALTLKFEIDGSVDGQEDYEGIVLTKTLWYSKDADGSRLLNTKQFQILEALQGGDELDNGENSEDLNHLKGRRCLLHIIDAGANEWPDISKIAPFVAKAPKKKAATPAAAEKPAPKQVAAAAEEDDAPAAAPAPAKKKDSNFNFDDDE